MPVLENEHWELFAQAKAKGMRNADAYRAAGYNESDNIGTINAGAGRLKANPEIKARIAELLEEAAEEVGVTLVRTLKELANIGFGDIRGVVTVDENGVTVKHSKDWSPEHAAMVEAVSETKDGIKIKMHGKNAALDMLGRYLKMFTDKHELTGKDGGPIQSEGISDIEAARRVAFILAKGLNAA